MGCCAGVAGAWECERATHCQKVFETEGERAEKTLFSFRECEYVRSQQAFPSLHHFPVVVAPPVDPSAARTASELIEILTDPGRNGPGKLYVRDPLQGSVADHAAGEGGETLRQGEAGVQLFQLLLRGNGPEQESPGPVPAGELPVAGQEEAPLPERTFQESGIVGFGAEEGVESGETEMACQAAQVAVGQKAQRCHRGPPLRAYR